MQKALSGRLYYGWAVFLALLVSAGVRAAPAVLSVLYRTDPPTSESEARP